MTYLMLKKLLPIAAVIALLAFVAKRMDASKELSADSLEGFLKDNKDHVEDVVTEMVSSIKSV